MGEAEDANENVAHVANVALISGRGAIPAKNILSAYASLLLANPLETSF